MQTFLPCPDFEQSARVLDAKRLGKQRVEVIQVVRALTRPGYGWANHPAVLMWRGYEEALGRYGFVCCEVWSQRGFGDTCARTIGADLAAAGVTTVRSQAELAAADALPPWLGEEALHRSHQSALIRKNPEYYGPQFPGVPDDLPYHWPVRSATAVAAEEQQRERALIRERRAIARAHEEAERARRRRSRAARRGWATRRARQGGRPDRGSRKDS